MAPTPLPAADPTDDHYEVVDTGIQDPSSPTDSEGWPSTPSSTEAALPSKPSTPTTQVLTWTDAVAKGRNLYNMMLAPTTSYSHFTNPNELRNWGYVTTLRSIMPFQHTYHSLLRLLVPRDELDAKQISSTHILTATAATTTTTIPITDAHFTNILDLTHGILIAGSNFGPAHTYPDELDGGEELPALRHWSDIAYLQAQYMCSPASRVSPGSTRPRADTIQGLNYIMRHDIENPSTNLIVHELLQLYVSGSCSYNVVDEGCPYCSVHLEWPGLMFEIGSEEGMALLGTPNGRGVVWLLRQHGEFEGRRVGKVSVWCDVEKVPLKPSLLFHLEDIVDIDDEDGNEAVELLEEVGQLEVKEDKEGDL